MPNRKVPKPSRVTRGNNAGLEVRKLLPSARGSFAKASANTPDPVVPKNPYRPRAGGEIIRSAPGVVVTNEEAQAPRKLSKTASVGMRRAGRMDAA
jgi:hypothetical protein